MGNFPLEADAESFFENNTVKILSCQGNYREWWNISSWGLGVARHSKALVGLGWIGWRFFQNKVLLLTLGTSMLEFVKAEIVSDLHQILELCHYISLKPR